MYCLACCSPHCLQLGKRPALPKSWDWYCVFGCRIDLGVESLNLLAKVLNWSPVYGLLICILPSFENSRIYYILYWVFWSENNYLALGVTFLMACTLISGLMAFLLPWVLPPETCCCRKRAGTGCFWVLISCWLPEALEPLWICAVL